VRSRRRPGNCARCPIAARPPRSRGARVNGHHYIILLDKNRTWNHEFCLRTINYIIPPYESVDL
jgi:hypothetical protein